MASAPPRARRSAPQWRAVVGTVATVAGRRGSAPQACERHPGNGTTAREVCFPKHGPTGRRDTVAGSGAGGVVVVRELGCIGSRGLEVVAGECARALQRALKVRADCRGNAPQLPRLIHYSVWLARGSAKILLVEERPKGPSKPPKNDRKPNVNALLLAKYVSRVPHGIDLVGSSKPNGIRLSVLQFLCGTFGKLPPASQRPGPALEGFGSSQLLSTAE